MSESIRFLLQSAFTMTLFYLFYRVLLKNETFFDLNRFLLLIIMPMSLIIPLIHIPSPFVEMKYSAFAAIEPGDSVTAAAGINIWDVLTLLYFAGVIVFSIKFIAGLIRLALLVRRHGVQRGDIQIRTD